MQNELIMQQSLKFAVYLISSSVSLQVLDLIRDQRLTFVIHVLVAALA